MSKEESEIPRIYGSEMMMKTDKEDAIEWLLVDHRWRGRIGYQKLYKLSYRVTLNKSVTHVLNKRSALASVKN